MMQRHQVDGHAEADVGRALGNRGEEQQGRRHHGEARREMHLGEPHGVEAEAVGLGGFGDQLAIALGGDLSGSFGELVEDIELHAALPQYAPRTATRSRWNAGEPK